MGWPGIPENVNPRIYLLWLVRNGRVDDWTSLATEFGIDPESRGTAAYGLRSYLDSLHSAGLVELEHGPNERFRVRIRLSENWAEIQLALKVSLTELTNLGDSAIIVTPYFGKPRPASGPADLFVLMPFDPELQPVYEDHIAGSARELGLSLARGDDFFTANAVMSDVWTAIMSARAVVADCTGRNPNVFYEIGLAHAVGKPVILIAQHSDDVPFDLRHLRYIQYEYTPRGMQIFEKRLTDTLRTELDRSRLPAAFDGIVFMVADESDASLAQLGRETSAVRHALSREWRAVLRGVLYVPDLEAALRDAGLESRLPNVVRRHDFKPGFVHVVGHAGGSDTLLVGTPSLSPAELADVLRRRGQHLRCLVLSACFNEEQADAMATRLR
jgi:hypothetical protein